MLLYVIYVYKYMRLCNVSELYRFIGHDIINQKQHLILDKSFDRDSLAALLTFVSLVSKDERCRKCRALQQIGGKISLSKRGSDVDLFFRMTSAQRYCFGIHRRHVRDFGTLVYVLSCLLSTAWVLHFDLSGSGKGIWTGLH